jgi:hypothetical protein
LAGIGLGAVGAGGLSLGRSRPAYTHYTYASDGDLDDRRVRVAWYERYNGRRQETQAGTDEVAFDAALDPDSEPDYVTDATLVTDASGPVVTVGNVLPGDEGTLVVGLEVVDSEEFIAEPLDIWFRGTVTDDTEGGVNEVEQTAGDTTAADGELDEELLVELWRDGSPLGTCNGHKEFTESLEAPIVESAPIRTAFGPDGVGSAAGERVITSLAPGRSRCVALAWSFPAEATNRTQGDGVGFSLAFAGVPAGAASPFAEENA